MATPDFQENLLATQTWPKLGQKGQDLAKFEPKSIRIGLYDVVRVLLLSMSYVSLISGLVGFAVAMVALIGSFIAGARWLTRKLSEFGDRYLGYFGERYVAEWLDAGAQLQEATPFLEMILENLLAVDRRGWPIQLRR